MNRSEDRVLEYLVPQNEDCISVLSNTKGPVLLLWGAKVLHFLGVDVEVVAAALEIAVWAEFDDFPHK
jgi:hypothetical protein